MSQWWRLWNKDVYRFFECLKINGLRLRVDLYTCGSFGTLKCSVHMAEVWYDVNKRETVVDWRRSSVWRCTIQLRMWPWECVGWRTAWSRSNIWRRSFILIVAARPKWTLKSPKMKGLSFNWLQTLACLGTDKEHRPSHSILFAGGRAIQTKKMNSTLGNRQF